MCYTEIQNTIVSHTVFQLKIFQIHTQPCWYPTFSKTFYT